MKITVVDPKINHEEVLNITGLISLPSTRPKKYSIILALYHDEFKSITKDNLLKYSIDGTLIFDRLII